MCSRKDDSHDYVIVLYIILKAAYTENVNVEVERALLPW